jgi:hypothetical protein
MRKATRDEVIGKIRKVHGDVFDYSKLVYINNSTKIELCCNTCKTTFHSLLGNLTKGKGCPNCGKLKSQKTNTMPFSTFKKKLTDVHKSKYILLTTEDQYYLTKVTDKLSFSCTEHGTFYSRKSDILKGRRCKKCANAELSKLKASTKKEFVEKASLVHSNTYDYSKVAYVNAKTKVIITCPVHGDFEQTPGDHLSGRGCQSCTSYGFKSKEPAIMYYLKINNGQAYKIGITNSSVNERFKPKELKAIEVIQTWEFSTGLEAREEEKKIINKYKNHKYTGVDLLASGNTELFDKDILNLDKETQCKICCNKQKST